ncbi:MAG: hypothetical protein KDE14_02980 [Rhodobacteraceae bacterium]|nr:hypothetical protein [Paracoccaceae bacterium]
MSAAITDIRLKPVAAALTGGRVKVLSVDIFDTLLWRRVPEPKDIFPLLAGHLRTEGVLAPHVSRVEFAFLRETAEQAARARRQAATGSREITLADIYAEIPDFVFSVRESVAARAQREEAFERASMCLDSELAALMTLAAESGVGVILVSDTYFSAAALRAMLESAGFTAWDAVSKLYVSNEAGRPKWRDLFDTVLTDQAVKPEDMIHIGDNVDADVTPCRMRGIPFLHYDKWAFAPRAKGHEWPQEREPRATALESGGDHGLTGLRSRIAHRPPANLDPSLHPYWSYGAAVLAPVFAAFARWIVLVCRDESIGCLYGIMREGRFINRVVAATARHLDVKIELKELWLSRRAVLAAGLFEDDLAPLDDIILTSTGRTTDEVCADIGLGQGDLAGILPAGFSLPLDADMSVLRTAIRILADAIVSTPHARKKVLEESARRRTNLIIAVQRAIGAANGARAVLTDLGYAGTIQAVLGRILAREQKQVRLTGLYMSLTKSAAFNLLAGADLRAYLNHDGFDGMTPAVIARTPDLIEQACMCREGSLSHFDASGQPVLLPSLRNESQLVQMEALQDGIVAGVESINQLWGSLDAHPGDDPAIRRHATAILTAAILYPSQREIASIGQWQHEANANLADVRKLAEFAPTPDELSLIAERGWPALQDIGRLSVYWPAAAFSAADPFLGDVFAAGARDSYRAKHLTSGAALGAVMMTPDTGNGFDPSRRGSLPLETNPFGRGTMAAAVKPFGAETYRRIALSWPKVRAIISLDRVEATYVGETDRVVTVLKADDIAWRAARDVAPGVVETAADGSVAEFTLNPPSWLHAVEIDIHFKYLRLDGLFGQG